LHEDPRVDAMLAETLEGSPNARFRWAAAHWLSERGCVQARKVLMRALADTDPIVALAAVGAMAKFGDSTAIAPLRDLADEHSAGPAVGVSRAALAAIDKILERAQASGA
jgi:HEAT repeat protein